MPKFIHYHQMTTLMEFVRRAEVETLAFCSLVSLLQDYSLGTANQGSIVREGLLREPV
jgi:hypothetical protein